TTDTEARDIAAWRLRIYLKEGESILPDLERALSIARQLGRGWRALKLTLLKVLALHPSRPAHAESLLAEAVLEGATNGFIRTFADEGAPLAQYFQQWREREYLPQGIERHYLESLIQAAEQS